MRTVRFTIVSMILTAVFAVSALAQAPANSNVAFVNTEAFYNQNGGITAILNGYKRLQSEFKPDADKYQGKVTEFTNLKKTYDTLVGNAQKNIPVNQDDLNKKREQLLTLQTDIKRMQEDLKAKQEKREVEIMGPILKEIGKTMQTYAKQKGYTLVLDVSRVASAQMLIYMDEKSDITKDFITFYNAKPAGTATK